MGSYQSPTHYGTPAANAADLVQVQLDDMARANDAEAGEKASRPAKRHSGSDSVASCLAGFLLLFLFLLVVACLAGIIFGITVGVERGLTGEDTWTKGHDDLFRICESPSTSSSTSAVHTCNVYRPRQDLNSPPIHSFTERIRPWFRGGRAPSGSATRIRAVTLESMLLERGLRCSPSPSNGAPRQPRRAQIIIRGVGQSFGYRRRAKACNFDQNGRNIQNHCGEYGDGGLKAAARSHPLSINQIFEKHFGMTCTWV